MHCDQVRPLLSASLDGELTARERQSLEAHLERCPDCTAYREKINRVGRLFREMEIPALSPDLTGRIMARIIRQPVLNTGLFSLLGTFMLLAFLAVLLLLLLSPAGGLLFALLRVLERNLSALLNLGTKLPVTGTNLFWSTALLLFSGILFYALHRIMRAEMIGKEIHP